jgi:polyhydroxyalkanoate synthesis regulator phasin
MARRDRNKATREAARARKAAREAAQASGQAAAALFRDRWQAAVGALSAAEAQVGRKVQVLMREKKLTGRDASVAVRDLGKRLEKERKKAGRNLEARLTGLQKRVAKDSQALGRSAEQAVERAMGALNIPSRADVSRLARKVDELSRKLDRLRRARKR